MTAQIRFFDPHPQLASTLMSFLTLDIKAGAQSCLPAQAAAAIRLTIHGDVTAHMHDGKNVHLPRFSVQGPNFYARRIVYDTDTFAISVNMRPGQLRSSLGISPSEILGEYRAMDEILSQSVVNHFLATLDTHATLEDRVDCLQRFLIENLDLTRSDPMVTRFLQAHRNISLPVIEFAMKFELGKRQFERRFCQTYGMPLRAARRVFRFGRALRLILPKSHRHGDLTAICYEAGYFDQAHMYRDFVEMTGLPPRELLEKIESGDPAYWLYRLDPADFERAFVPFDPGVV